MAEYDKSKFYSKKKFVGGSSKDSSNTFQERRPYKGPPKDFDKSFTIESKPKNIKKTTILAREHHVEDRSVSPKNTSSSSKDNSDSNQPISITSPSPHSGDGSSVLKRYRWKNMTRSIKLLEDGGICSEQVQEYLQQENEDYLVVGIVGAQGVGKSTMLNLLAHDRLTSSLKKDIFSTYVNEGSDSDKENLCLNQDSNVSDSSSSSEPGTKEKADAHIFKPESEEEIFKNANCTNGIDLYITNNRIMFLDCQPFGSPAILDILIRSESKHSNQVNEFLPLENIGEIVDLQMSAFLMSVCHVVILVQDWFFDSNIVRFIQSAEMLKPTISNHEEEQVDQFPHLVLLHNKALMEDFAPKKFKEMQEMYSLVFNKTKLHLKSNLGIGTGIIVDHLTPQNCGDPINLFLIPKYSEKDDELYCGHPGLEALVKSLRSNILGSTKYSLNNTSEKHWLLNCTKVWDHIKKSNFFIEYNKLMP